MLTLVVPGALPFPRRHLVHGSELGEAVIEMDFILREHGIVSRHGRYTLCTIWGLISGGLIFVGEKTSPGARTQAHSTAPRSCGRTGLVQSPLCSPHVSVGRLSRKHKLELGLGRLKVGGEVAMRLEVGRAGAGNADIKAGKVNGG